MCLILSCPNPHVMDHTIYCTENDVMNVNQKDLSFIKINVASLYITTEESMYNNVKMHFTLLYTTYTCLVDFLDAYILCYILQTYPVICLCHLFHIFPSTPLQTLDILSPISQHTSNIHYTTPSPSKLLKNPSILSTLAVKLIYCL